MNAHSPIAMKMQDLILCRIVEVREHAETKGIAETARAMGLDPARFGWSVNSNWFKALGITFARTGRARRVFDDPAVKAAMLADLRAGMSREAAARKYDACAASIYNHAKAAGIKPVVPVKVGPKPYAGAAARVVTNKRPVAQVIADREAETRRQAELAASVRRAKLLATKGEKMALWQLRQDPEFRLAEDGRHVMTLDALKAKYDEMFKGVKK